MIYSKCCRVMFSGLSAFHQRPPDRGDRIPFVLQQDIRNDSRTILQGLPVIDLPIAAIGIRQRLCIGCRETQRNADC